jgi:hypothetical protein
VRIREEWEVGSLNLDGAAVIILCWSGYWETNWDDEYGIAIYIVALGTIIKSPRLNSSKFWLSKYFVISMRLFYSCQ